MKLCQTAFLIYYEVLKFQLIFLSERYHIHNLFSDKEECKSIHTSKWPKYNQALVDESAELTGDLGVDIINIVRKFKSEQQLSLKEELQKLILVSSEDKFQDMVESIKDDLKAVLKVKEISFSGETTLETEKFAIKVGILR